MFLGKSVPRCLRCLRSACVTNLYQASTCQYAYVYGPKVLFGYLRVHLSASISVDPDSSLSSLLSSSSSSPSYLSPITIPFHNSFHQDTLAPLPRAFALPLPPSFLPLSLSPLLQPVSHRDLENRVPDFGTLPARSRVGLRVPKEVREEEISGASWLYYYVYKNS